MQLLCKKGLLRYFFIIVLMGGLGIVGLWQYGYAQSGSNFTITIIPGPECYDGEDNDEDGLIDFPDDDDCDSTSDVTEGIPPPPPSSPSNSSGPQPSGGTGLVIEPSTSIVFSGYAYPGSQVTLLRDAQRIGTVTTGADARFYISLSGLNPGNSLFILYAESAAGRRSALYPIPIVVNKGALTSIAGIVLSPTIILDKIGVHFGGDIEIAGDAAPGALVHARLLPEGREINIAYAQADGTYAYSFNTEGLERGDYVFKVAATIDGLKSPYSVGQSFTIGDEDVLPREPSACGKGDLNCDGRVNLVDFSIAAFWYQQPLTGDVVAWERDVLNSDGKIDLKDLSIMAYYWTG